jgi:diguanylate cyclase (GGDEF)-like protein
MTIKTPSDAKIRIPRPLVFAISGLCVAGLCAVDYFMEPHFSFLIFFLFPVCFASWIGGKKTGIAISVLSAAAWIFSDILSMEKYAHPVIPYWNMTTTFIVFLIVSLMMSKLKKTLQLATDLARIDPVTGIANRRAFSEFAAIELYRINRYKRPFTLACLDIEDIKKVNDDLGIQAGDNILRGVATVISDNVRSSDIRARLDSGEFAVLLTETNEDQAKAVIEKLSNSLQEAFKKEKWDITFNIGVVTYIRPPATVDEMLKKADHMMHTAKREGKNTAHYLVWRESAIVR